MIFILRVTSLPVGAGPEFSHPAVVKTALTPLASVGASFQYPPINWSAVLSPLMRLSFGKSYHIFMLLYLGACRAKALNSASFSLLQERMYSISVWCWQRVKLNPLRVPLSFWAPGCHRPSFTVSV